MMRYVPTFMLAVFVVLAGANVLAHEVTYRGTVLSADAKVIRMAVVDAKTQKPSTWTFDHDKNTKFLRGDTLTTFADARLEKGEKIALTINNDKNEKLALVVRLDPKK